jgi:hypothetical protein
VNVAGIISWLAVVCIIFSVLRPVALLTLAGVAFSVATVVAVRTGFDITDMGISVIAVTTLELAAERWQAR